MSRGHWDWNVKTDQFGAYDLDEGELAARLGSQYVFYRTGKTILVDSFPGSVAQWTGETDGAGGSIAWDTTYAFYGLGCMKITAPNAAGDYQGAHRLVPLIDQGKIGLEVIVALEGAQNILDVMLNTNIGGSGRQHIVRLDAANEKIQYRNSAGTYVDAFDGILAGSVPPPSWMLIKLVVDMDNGEYERVYFNGDVVDLDGIKGLTAASGLPDHLLARVRVIDDAGANTPCYVDGLVLTSDEP